MSAPLRLPPELALVCSACGAAGDDPLAFRCPAARAGDDIDHVLVPPEPPLDAWADDAPPDGADPFVRYRTMLFPYRLHRAWGGGDDGYVALVEELQEAIDRLDGRRFRTTPLRPVPAAAMLGRATATGRVWVKDETVNPSGSHKGRHLLGLALHLRVVSVARARSGAEPADRERAGGERAGATPPRLAISSCGNAALAAAVVASAAGHQLEVFVPPDAATSVLQRLDALGATITVCPRAPGERGDPCFTRFLGAVGSGALPFTAQGPQNGLTLDGAATLGYELADQLQAAGVTPGALAVQVGGGALGASVALGLRRAVERGRLERLPSLYTVQTAGAAPLERADRLVHAAAGDAGSFDRALAHAARHRSSVMWPWEEPPHSIAGGILDDETYDWRALVAAMHESGGGSVIVTEEQLARANEIGRSVTGIDADHTGTAGLAGLLALAAAGRLDAAGDAIVLFTGQRR